MTTVVAIMDRADWSANTDNLVVVQPSRRTLLWVPRDLWSVTIGDRVNTAFALGGHRSLIAVLAEHGIRVDHSICVRRDATERALSDLVVAVPVPRLLTFWYPLSPQAAIEDGRKLISFVPPSETLSGERLHQWIGARMEPRRAGGSDFSRISRQQVLLRALLSHGFDFRTVLADPESVRVSNALAIAEAGRVRPDWHFRVMSNVENTRIDGKAVMVPRTGRLSIRALSRLRRSSRARRR
jgi:anionic cell wall polymer biosynthesis LytR-Cps2A-Psr (LCP) family protein